MKILAVDDDLISRLMLFEALKISGYEDVTLAASGIDALMKIKLSDNKVISLLLILRFF